MNFIRLLAVFCLFLPTNAIAQPVADSITEDELRGHIAVLADDDFGGRKPGTIYENKTVNYIATEWMKAGLKPAAKDNSWYQSLPFAARTTISQSGTLTAREGERSKVRALSSEDIKIRGVKQSSSVANAQLVFAGFNTASSQQLRAAVDGKAALILWRAPEDAPKDAADIASYSERVQQLRDAGATAILTLVEDNAWERMSRRFARRSVSLAGDGKHAALEGIVNIKAITKAARYLRADFNTMLDRAADSNFLPQALPIYADLNAQTQVQEYLSHNVVGKIAGREPAAGMVLYTGHWDHLGTCGEADAANPDKDLICNGAIDNASGIAVLIEAAKRLAKTPHDRDIYFVATTSEELGLLGAQGFAESELVDLKKIVAVFNVDTVALAPNGKKIAIVGRGKSTRDKDLEIVAAEEGRDIDKSDAANAFVDRQDGAIFLRRGIPAYMVTSAFADPEKLQNYLSGPYHSASDELNEGLLLGGAVDDANFHVALGEYFASTSRFTPPKAEMAPSAKR